MANTVQEFIKRFREEYPCNYSLFLEFNGTTFCVKANREEIVSNLAEYFKPFVRELDSSHITITVHEAPEPDFDFEFTIKKPDPGKTKIKEEFVNFPDGRIVRKRLTGMVFLFGNGEHLAIGPCMANLNQVVNFINNRYIEAKLLEGCLLGHASAVQWREKGIAIAGFSGMGKSTLALHLMSKGATFISNDRLMVKDEGDALHMFGVAKLPRINPGTIVNNPDLHVLLSKEERERFLSLCPEELWNLEQKYDVFIDKCFGENRFTLGGRLHLLVILNWHLNESLRPSLGVVDIDKRRDLLRAFIKKPGLFFLPPKNIDVDLSDQRYVEILSKCVVVEIKGKIDFSWAVEECLNFIETL